MCAFFCFMSSYPAQTLETPHFFYNFLYIIVKTIKIMLSAKLFNNALSPSFILEKIKIDLISVKVDQIYFEVLPGAKKFESTKLTNFFSQKRLNLEKYGLTLKNFKKLMRSFLLSQCRAKERDWSQNLNQ